MNLSRLGICQALKHKVTMAEMVMNELKGEIRKSVLIR